MLIPKTSNIVRSKCLTDRKLKTFCFVVESNCVAGIRIQRDSVRKTEQTQGRKPLHRDSGRSFEIIIIEVVVDRCYVVDPQEFDLIAGLKYVAQVVEPAHPRGALPFFGHREYQLQAVDYPEVSAVRIADADVVARP